MTTVVHMTSVHGAHDTRILHRECASLLGSHYTPILLAPGESSTIGGVCHVGIGPRRGLLGRFLLTHPRLLFVALKQRARAYHFHDPELIFVGLILKLLGAKVVYDVHEYYSEIIPLKLPAALRSAAKLVVHQVLEKVPSRVFDHLVFPTDALRREYADPTRSSVLFNFPLMNASVEVESPASGRDFDIIFVGTVSPFRAKVMVEVAIELVLRGVDLRFLFVGIANATVDWIRANFDRAFVERHLVFVPRVGYQQVLDYMARSRVGYNYHPDEKRFEVAIPMKVFEYMLAGIPAVTTRFPELERLLEGGKEIIFCDVDVPAQADAIGSLLQDESHAGAIAEAGRRAVKTRLNWAATESQKLTELYDRLLK